LLVSRATRLQPGSATQVPGTQLSRGAPGGQGSPLGTQEAPDEKLPPNDVHACGEGPWSKQIDETPPPKSPEIAQQLAPAASGSQEQLPASTVHASPGGQ
jgi:hypothetical protein